MAEKYLFGFDLGTQGAKALLVDLDGRVVATAYQEHTIQSPQPGWAEQDAESTWWKALATLSRRLLQESGIRSTQVVSVGVSGMVPGLVAVDRLGAPVRPAILYTDRRAEGELHLILTRLREAGLPDSEAGTLASTLPVVHLMWLRRHEPEEYARTAKILQAAPYLVMRLTGEDVIDHSLKRLYAPLYDANLDGWSQERAALFNLDVGLLPSRIAWAATVAGTVSNAASRETDLAQGTPVAVGIGDAFAEMICAGAVVPDVAAAIYASLTAILVTHAHPVLAWDGFHCLPNLFFSGCSVPSGAILARWFRDQFGLPEGGPSNGQGPYEVLDGHALQIAPGADGLIALPALAGEMSSLHPGLKAGAIVGLTTQHTRWHVFRALIEGVAYELRFQLSGLGEVPRHMTAVGGAARSKVWTQIVSDVLGSTQDVLDVPHSAPLGAAYLGGMAAGLFPDTKVMRGSWRRVSRTVQPNPSSMTAYDSSFKAYCAVRQAILGPVARSWPSQ